MRLRNEKHWDYRWAAELAKVLYVPDLVKNRQVSKRPRNMGSLFQLQSLSEPVRELSSLQSDRLCPKAFGGRTAVSFCDEDNPLVMLTAVTRDITVAL